MCHTWLCLEDGIFDLRDVNACEDEMRKRERIVGRQAREAWKVCLYGLRMCCEDGRSVLKKDEGAEDT